MLEELRRLEIKSAGALADAVGQAIHNGALRPGQRLPSIRAVAAELKISPSTVSSAWAILTRGGLIHSESRRGTVVSDRTSPGPARYQRALQYSAQFEIDLSAGLPDQDLLPDLEPGLRRLKKAGPLQTYLDQPIVAELRDHLHAQWPCPAEAITVADGAMDALDLLTATHLRFGDRVAVERRTDPPLLDLLEAIGVKIVPVDIDAHGPVVESVSTALVQGARTFFLQPRAHHPTGVSISPSRAGQLAGVFRRFDALVVEIDFVGAVATAAPLSVGRHIPDQTVHISGYSTSHGPELRLAAIGGPERVLERLIRRRHLGQGWTSRLLQLLLLDLLTDESAIAQVDHARQEYARRRTALVTALSRHGVEALGEDGLYVWLPVANEATALVSLASRGIGVAPGTPFSADNRLDPHLCVTAGVLPAEQADDVAAILADAALPGAVASGLRRGGGRGTGPGAGRGAGAARSAHR